jgi:hypothetical protein
VKLYLTCLHCLRETKLPENEFDQAAAIDTFALVHGQHANPDEIAVTTHEPWWSQAVRAAAQVKN